MSILGKITIIFLLALILLLASTDPRQVPSIVLIAPFILLFVILWLFFTALLRRFGLTKSKNLRTGLLIASLPILLLVLQSLGQLTIRDVFAMLALFAIAYFYIARLTMRASS